MLELEDTLSMYGLGIEDASRIEEDYHEYTTSFTGNRLYLKAVSELTNEIFQRFYTGDEEEAKRAHHEIVALQKIVTRLKNVENDYLKVQAVKDVEQPETY